MKLDDAELFKDLVLALTSAAGIGIVAALCWWWLA